MDGKQIEALQTGSQRRLGKRRLVILVSAVLLAVIGILVFKFMGHSQQQRAFETARSDDLAAGAQNSNQSTIETNNEQKLNDLEALLETKKELGNSFELIEIADQLLEIDSDHIPALDAKAAALFSDRQFDEASPFLDRLIIIEPGNIKWRNWKLQLLSLQGDAEEKLLSQCDNWIAEQPDNAHFRLIKAQQLAQFGHNHKARSEAEEAVTKGVKTLWELQTLIAILNDLGAQDAAAQAIEDAKRKFPNEMWVRQTAARRLLRNGQIALALKEIEEAERAINELSPDMLQLRASALLVNDEIKKARKIIRFSADDAAQQADAVSILAGILEQSPNSCAALSLISEAYMHTSPTSPNQAIGYLKQALELYPAQTSLYPRLISLLQLQGEYETASTYIDRFGEQALHDIDLTRLEIKLLIAQGEFDAAADRASSLAQLSSLDTDNLSLASLYQRTGRLQQAQEIYDQLLSKPQPSSLVLVQAADYYASLGKADKADAIIDSLSKDDITPATATLLGRYYQRHRNLELSEHWLRTALNKQPRLADAWLVLAQNYLYSNDTDLAYEAAVDGLKISPNHLGLQGLFAVSIMKRDVGGVERAIEQLQVFDAPAKDLIATLKLLKIIRLAGEQTPPTSEHMEKAQELISDHGTFLPAWLLAITINERAGEFTNAAELARKASKRYPSRAEPAQWATQLLIRTQRWDVALWQSQEWRNRSLNDPAPADKAAAQILLELGRYAEAVERMRPYAKSIISNRRDYPDHLSSWIRMLMLDGRVDEAYIIIKPLLSNAKWCRLWLALIQIIDPVDAESALRLTEAQLISDDEAVLQLAAAWSALGVRTGESKMQLEAERLIESAKDVISAQLVKGSIAEAREDWTVAEAIYRKVIDQDQNNLAALNNLAFVLCQTTNASSEALEFVERALVLAPDHPDILDTYALVLIEFERFSDAQLALMRAHESRPNDAAISLLLAETTLRMGQTEEAWQMLHDIEGRLRIRPAIDPKLQIRADKLRRLIYETQASVEVPIVQ